MGDSDLDAIRQARRQELQSQQGGGQGGDGGGGGGQEDERKYAVPLTKVFVLHAHRKGRINIICLTGTAKPKCAPPSSPKSSNPPPQTG